MTDETHLAIARRKSLPPGPPRELLHIMAAQADAGAPEGIINEWHARMPELTRKQTATALERLITAGHITKAWDATRYLWVYRITP